MSDTVRFWFKLCPFFRAAFCAGLLLSQTEGGLLTACGADEASDALLDEVAAAVDANMVLIQCGVAKYRANETTYKPVGTKVFGPNRSEVILDKALTEGPYNSETIAYFDYPRVRFDWRGQRGTTRGGVVQRSDRTIFDGEYRIYTAERAHPFARIEPEKHGYESLRAMHPRRQAYPGWLVYLGSERLAKVRRAGGWKLTASKEQGGLIKVVADGKTGRNSFWLSPNDGYSVVKAKLWGAGEGEGEIPYQVHEATFRKAENGAFVLDHRVSHELLKGPDGKWTPSRDEEVTLLEIEMRDALDPKLFTLDGLELPAGAKIIDTVQGREYPYAVPAADRAGDDDGLKERQ